MKMTGSAVKKAVMAIAMVGLFAVLAHGADDPKTIWESVRNRWNKDINSYEADIFAWGWQSPQWIKYHTDICPTNVPEEKKCKPNWRFRIYHVKFKKPLKFLFSYEYSANENIETSNIIDKAISYVFLYVPGTLLNYGVKDDKLVYVKMPMITDTKWSSVPVSAVDKGAMKLLMIASRSEIYFKTLAELPDPRGYYPYDLEIGRAMKHFDHFFKDGTIKADRVGAFSKDNYTIDKRSGFMTANIKSGTDWIRLTMIPKDIAKNKGISKVELFVDPKINMFIGLHEYEKDKNGKDKLMGVLMFMNLKLNVAIPDTEFLEKFFEKRKISDKGH